MPEIEVISFAVEDVLTTSNPTETEENPGFIGDCLGV
jgi:hypothetical protein